MLRFDYKDELIYHKIKADRSICPKRPDFNRLYSAFNREKYGSKNGKEMFQQLDPNVCDYIEKYPEFSIEFQQYEDSDEHVQPFILTIMTPLMKRVHSMRHWWTCGANHLSIRRCTVICA